MESCCRPRRTRDRTSICQVKCEWSASDFIATWQGWCS